MKKRSFRNLLDKLSLQSGEEKLKISFKLSLFVQKLRKEGEAYAKKQSELRSGAAS